MRAFSVHELTHPSNISLEENVAEPAAGPQEILVDIFAAGLNFIDVLQAQGKYQTKPPLPFILGSEFAGRISPDSPIPEGCKLQRGQRVFGAGQGSFADKVAANYHLVFPLPENFSYEQGAGLSITWPTSYEAIVGRANLKRGEWILVTAAVGGVGIAAVQIAKALGAKVIAAVGSDEKMEIAKKYGGADHSINYSKTGWQNDVLAITQGKGVDVVYDPVGLINESLKCIAWKGRLLVVGFAAGTIEKVWSTMKDTSGHVLLSNNITPQVPTNLILLKNISIIGIYWGAYTTREPSHVPVVWKELLSLLGTGKLQPVVYSPVYPLEQIADGLAVLESRKSWGKVVARVRDDDKPNRKANL